MEKSKRLSQKYLQKEEERVRMAEGDTVLVDREVALQVMRELKVLRFKMYQNTWTGVRGR